MSEVHKRREGPDALPVLQADRKRKKLIAIVVGFAFLLGGGAAAIAVTSGNDQTSGSGSAAELVLGSDGEPLQYVEYSEEHMDRDNNGSDDHGWDNNRNFIDDSEDLWDQEKQEFVDPLAGSNETALEQASEDDKAEMGELLSRWPTIGESDPHWAANFVMLDQRVQDYILAVANDPQGFESEVFWRGAILSGFDYTAEELEESVS